MEAETADMVDRRMMSLFALGKKKLDKGDMQNMSEVLQHAKSNGTSALYG
jgi:hypothetical protein